MYARRQSVDEADQTQVEPGLRPGPDLQDFGSNQANQQLPTREAPSLLELAATPVAGGGEADGPTQVPFPDVTVQVTMDPKYREAVMAEAVLRAWPFACPDDVVARLREPKGKEQKPGFYLSPSGSSAVATPEQIATWGQPGQPFRLTILGATARAIFEAKLGTVLDDLRDGLPAALGLKLRDLVLRMATGDAGGVSELVELAKSDAGVAAALNRFAARPEAAGNAGVQLAVATLRARELIGFVGPPGEVQEQQLAEVRKRVDLATQAAAKGDGEEAAALNLQAAALYEQLGQKQLADERRMIARMYEASFDERHGRSTTIPRVSPDRTSMSAPIPQDQALWDFYARNPGLDPRNAGKEPAQYEIGAKSTQDDQLYSVSIPGTKPNDQPVDGFRVGKTRVPDGTIVEGNSRGLAGANVAGPGANLLQQAEIWIQAHAAMMELAERLGERDRLQRASRAANTLEKPPKLFQIAEARKPLDELASRDDGRLAGWLREARRRLAVLEEASRALWPDQR